MASYNYNYKGHHHSAKQAAMPNSTGIPGGGNGTKKTVTNPYTKARTKTTQQVTAATSTAARPAAINKVPNAIPNKPSQPQTQNVKPPAADKTYELKAQSGSTFSEAFGSIEDTEHYKNSMREAQMQGDGDEMARAQRAWDAAQADSPTGQTDDEDRMSARDHHATFQPHVLYVSKKQRGNGVLGFIRNVPIEFSKMLPDYVMTKTSCALFLSCKYHSLHPEYIHRRIAELKTDFTLRVLLVLVDVDDNENILLFLNKLAVQQNFTLILAWTEEEAARYLESYKALDGNDGSLIKRKEKTNFVDQASDFLTGASGVNKTDAASLLTQFTSIRCIMAASKDELGLVPGLGQVKVKRLHDAFHKPFSSKRKRERMEAAQASLKPAKAEKGTDEAVAETANDRAEDKNAELGVETEIGGTTVSDSTLQNLSR